MAEIYHGTSMRTAVKILGSGLLMYGRIGHQAVSLTRQIEVARYFAKLATDYDFCHEDQAVEDFYRAVELRMQSNGVVLVMNEDALAQDYQLEPFSDPVWGKGECDWEGEICVYKDVYPIQTYVTKIYCDCQQVLSFLKETGLHLSETALLTQF